MDCTANADGGSKADDFGIKTTATSLSADSGSGSGNGHAGAGVGDGGEVRELDVGREGNEVSDGEGNGEGRKRWFSYLKTRQFWIVLLLGQILAICLTSTNTFSGLLAGVPWSIPTLQTLFNYIVLNCIYTTYTIYKYGWKKYGQLLWKDGWKYLILAFMDVEGNFLTVLAYRYTTILSAQLINFWAIVIVVAISFLFLKVRYHWTQVAGIIICIGGMGILIGSDHITGANTGQALNAVKGDLFALAGATFYGLSNIYEEWMVSKRPVYEVIGQMAFWAIPVNGVTMAIFDRDSFKTSIWTPDVGGYLVGFTLILSLFYSLVPLLFRLSSAAFFNISLLTANFWGVLIGLRVFGYSVHWMYPIAFVLIIAGLVTYFMSESVLGEAKKPWLGEGQEEGVEGVGTAKRRVRRPDAIV
ncbi:DUF914-domain-containing protein [Aulographum hederae CBS 113979]|uniref:DUF914-domain-containing protein n=1 Tax=Aulographum hederae CBS 113979 TaxID=1176131 RepID=A0A6G1HCM9_9PEZI|nr:DUF914-domain-containing protein [Aulographum hederae CBS 113979]